MSLNTKMFTVIEVQFQNVLTRFLQTGYNTSNAKYTCIISDENHPPKANAGGDKIVTLPVSLVTLDGSKSSDDRGIISYLWTRDDKSLAVGVSMKI